LGLELNPARGFYEALGGEVIFEKPILLDGVSLKEVGYRWSSIHVLLARLAARSL